MAKIRHIALSSQDPDTAKNFYMDVFGLKMVRKTERPTHWGYILSDGYINLAILKFSSDAAAGKELGAGYSGLHHIGFHVDDMEAASKKVTSAGGHVRSDIDAAFGVGHAKAGSGGGEFKYADPAGVLFDLSQGGWATGSTM